MRHLKFSLLIFASLLFIASCKKDKKVTPEEKTLYEKAGAYIVNEGPFTGAGSVDFYEFETGERHAKIFQAENGGAVIGGVVQSMNIFDDKAFIVSNVGNKVEVVNHKDFKSAGTIGGLAQPRYIVEGPSDKAYVSQWGSTGSDGQIKVVNTTTYQVVDSFVLGGGPEQLLYDNGKLYVPNSGGYGSDTSVYIINTLNGEIAKKEAAPCPSQILKSGDGTIWVMAAGCFDANWNQGNGHIVKIENDQVTHTYEFPYGPLDNLTESPDGKYLFVTSSDGIYRFNKENGAFDSAPIVAGSFYGMDIDKTTKQLFASKAAPNADGVVYIYSLDDNSVPTLKDSTAAGIYPGEFFFQD